MIWAILVWVGVPLWLCALGIGVVVFRSRWLRNRPGNIPVRVLRSGHQRWTRGHAIWVSDVFAWRGSPAAWAEALMQVTAVHDRPASPAEVTQLPAWVMTSPSSSCPAQTARPSPWSPPAPAETPCRGPSARREHRYPRPQATLPDRLVPRLNPPGGPSSERTRPRRRPVRSELRPDLSSPLLDRQEPCPAPRRRATLSDGCSQISPARGPAGQ